MSERTFIRLTLGDLHPQSFEFQSEEEFVEGYGLLKKASIGWDALPKVAEKITETRKLIALPGGEKTLSTRAELIAEIQRLSKMLNT